MANGKQQNQNQIFSIYQLKDLFLSRFKSTEIFFRELKFAAIIFLFSFFLFFDLVLIPPVSWKFPSNEVVQIKEGLNLKEIENFLKEKNIIRSPIVFNLIVRAMKGEKNIKAGDYMFDKPYSVFDISKKIIAGDYGIEQKKIIITEGMTLNEIGYLFEKEGLFSKDELFEYSGCCGGKNPRIKLALEDAYTSSYDYKNTVLGKITKELPSNFILEGLFFPDTYFFRKNIEPKDAVKLILKNFNKKIEENFSIPEKKLYDVLIMASILEKEANTVEDKKMIADILWRRLDKKMLLQVDATLDYAINKNTFELTKSDLKTDSPYNTYKYEGLPKTPISNPGIESIKSAVKPTLNNYWFYLSDKNGVMHYSETYEEHKKNINEYLKDI